MKAFPKTELTFFKNYSGSGLIVFWGDLNEGRYYSIRTRELIDCLWVRDGGYMNLISRQEAIALIGENFIRNLPKLMPDLP